MPLCQNSLILASGIETDLVFSHGKKLEGSELPNPRFGD